MGHMVKILNYGHLLCYQGLIDSFEEEGMQLTIWTPSTLVPNLRNLSVLTL